MNSSTSQLGSREVAAGDREDLVPRGTDTALFRPEVLAQRHNPLIGTVLLTPRVSHRVFTLVALVACTAVLGLLFLAHFTRTARLNGWLVPQEGMVRIFAPRPGVIGRLKVSEGSHVRKGQPLLTLSDELQSTSLGATQAQVTRGLEERRRSLLNEQQQQRQLLAQQQEALSRRMLALDNEQAQIENEIGLLEARVAIAERTEAMHRQQYEKGFISELRFKQVEAETLEQRARLATLERGRLANRRERLSVQAELEDLPLKSQKERANLDRSISQLTQERAEAEARREIVISAPQDGTVTAIQAVPGANADISVPLLSLVPADSKLEAHLYSPSRAIGFVRPGQRVLLRHEAYPYQKFGHQEGEVVNVSRSAVSPGDLPRELAGLPGLTGLAAGASAEPVYRITASLSHPLVAADGQELSLQPGMLLEADVALERRRLIEWVLDPLYTVTGRWRE